MNIANRIPLSPRQPSIRIGRDADLDTRVRHAIRARIATGPCERPEVAAALAMSVRTMNRRLAESGHSFTGLRDEVRRQLALRYLARAEVPLREVPAMVGLSELAVLCRYCRRWFDTTPQALRRRLIAEDGIAG